MSVLSEIMQLPENRKHIRELKEHSKDLFPHSYRVAAMTEQIWPYLLKGELPVKEAVTGALFHDIGKIMIPEKILDKETGLTSEEMREIRKHPEYGARILSDRSVEIRDMALLHHEKADGSGYPYGYPGEMLSVSTRVLTVLDIYDAAASGRVYKKPCHDMEKIITILHEIPMMADRQSMAAVELIKAEKIRIPEGNFL